jgi:hypothetical protein
MLVCIWKGHIPPLPRVLLAHTPNLASTTGCMGLGAQGLLRLQEFHGTTDLTELCDLQD